MAIFHLEKCTPVGCNLINLTSKLNSPQAKGLNDQLYILKFLLFHVFTDDFNRVYCDRFNAFSRLSQRCVTHFLRIFSENGPFLGPTHYP